METVNLGNIGIPVFRINDINSTSNALQFSGSAPPVDGSLLLAVVKIDPAYDASFDNSASQHLLAFIGGTATDSLPINVGGGGGRVGGKTPAGWKILA